MKSVMIKYLVSGKKFARLIIIFWVIFLFAVSASAEQVPSLEENHSTVEASDPQKLLPGYQQTLQRAIDLVFLFIEAISSDTALATSFPRIGILNAPRVNIRQGPGLNEKIIGRIMQKGTVIKVLGHEGDWINVSFQGCLGWIYGKYLYIEWYANIDQEKVVPLEKADERREDIRLEEKKQMAIDFIRKIRWGPDNKNYFWINDLEGKMILEPLYPHAEGKNCIIFKDLNNKEIFVEFIRTGREKGQGFVDHHGLGYDDNKSNPRISLVRLFELWGWVVGTGIDLYVVEAYEEPEEVVLYFLLPPIDEEPPIDDEGPASPA
jgi:hypothetical protein